MSGSGGSGETPWWLRAAKSTLEVVQQADKTLWSLVDDAPTGAPAAAPARGAAAGSAQAVPATGSLSQLLDGIGSVVDAATDEDGAPPSVPPAPTAAKPVLVDDWGEEEEEEEGWEEWPLPTEPAETGAGSAGASSREGAAVASAHAQFDVPERSPADPSGQPPSAPAAPTSSEPMAASPARPEGSETRGGGSGGVAAAGGNPLDRLARAQPEHSLPTLRQFVSTVAGVTAGSGRAGSPGGGPGAAARAAGTAAEPSGPAAPPEAQAAEPSPQAEPAPPERAYASDQPGPSEREGGGAAEAARGGGAAGGGAARASRPAPTPPQPTPAPPPPATSAPTAAQAAAASGRVARGGAPAGPRGAGAKGGASFLDAGVSALEAVGATALRVVTRRDETSGRTELRAPPVAKAAEHIGQLGQLGMHAHADGRAAAPAADGADAERAWDGCLLGEGAERAPALLPVAPLEGWLRARGCADSLGALGALRDACALREARKGARLRSAQRAALADAYGTISALLDHADADADADADGGGDGGDGGGGGGGGGSGRAGGQPPGAARRAADAARALAAAAVSGPDAAALAERALRALVHAELDVLRARLQRALAQAEAPGGGAAALACARACCALGLGACAVHGLALGLCVGVRCRQAAESEEGDLLAELGRTVGRTAASAAAAGGGAAGGGGGGGPRGTAEVAQLTAATFPFATGIERALWSAHWLGEWCRAVLGAAEQWAAHCGAQAVAAAEADGAGAVREAEAVAERMRWDVGTVASRLHELRECLLPCLRYTALSDVI